MASNQLVIEGLVKLSIDGAGADKAVSEIKKISEQIRRNESETKTAAGRAVEIEKEKLSRIASINSENDRAILRQKILMAEKGSQERINLELKELKREHDAAVASAQSKIGRAHV